MRPVIVAGFLACPALLLAVACSQPPAAPVAKAATATAAPGPTDDAELLARGDYLVRIGGCNDSHTAGYGEQQGKVDRTQWLLGSALGFRGPWGTTYPTNLRLKLSEMDEAQWLAYSAQLHTRPPMPDFNVRTMDEDDRRAIYRFVRSLGTGGTPAPAYLPRASSRSRPTWTCCCPPPSRSLPPRSSACLFAGSGLRVGGHCTVSGDVSPG